MPENGVRSCVHFCLKSLLDLQRCELWIMNSWTNEFFALFRKCIGLERTGLLGIYFQVMVTSLAVVSVFLPSSPFWNNFEGVEKEDGYTSVIVLLTGITAARFGKPKFNENTLPMSCSQSTCSEIWNLWDQRGPHKGSPTSPIFGTTKTIVFSTNSQSRFAWVVLDVVIVSV